MRFAARDHRNVVVPIVRALTEAGHELVEDESADFFLIDFDSDRFQFRGEIDFYAAAGIPVILYPHGNGVPPIHYDGLFEPYAKVAGQMAFGPGEERLLRVLGSKRPVLNIGWVGVEQRPFRPTSEVRRVTFAPIHPGPDGRMIDYERKANALAFERLLEGPWELTVRFLQRLDDNGLWPDKRPRYVLGLPDGSVDEIDSADVVVAGWGSYLTLAVARGAPAVTYGQDGPTYSGLAHDPPVPRRRKHLYDDFVRYPLDLSDGPVEKVLAAAALSDTRVDAWRDNWVAPALRAPELADRIVRFVEQLSLGRRRRPLRRVIRAEDPSEKFQRNFRDTRLPHEFRWAPSDDGVLVEGDRLFWRPGDEFDRYLELLKRAILNICAPRDEKQYLRFLGLDDGADALSASGYERLSHLQRAVRTVVDEDVPGDVIEVGVGRGGGAMLMRAALGADKRKLYALDVYGETSLEDVNENFVRYGIETFGVSFVAGLFAAAIPSLKRPWSLIRLDGGTEAVELALVHLYPRLSPGGYFIVNDYATSGAASLAYPSDLRGPRFIDPVGAYWRRERSSEH